MANERISLTMAPGGENHRGNQLIGTLPVPGQGFTAAEVKEMHHFFSEKTPLQTRLLDLNALGGVTNPGVEKAAVLLIRNYLNNTETEAIYKELVRTKWDRKYLDPKKYEDLLDSKGNKVRDANGKIVKDRRRRGRVMNKHARANLCFADGVSQRPNYRNGEGTIVDWNTTLMLKGAKDRIVQDLKAGLTKKASKEKVVVNVIEGNRYFDLKKCGIGFHGDTERNVVIAVTIGGGGNYHLRWSWYRNSAPHGDPIDVYLNDGDVYVMSEKAVGTDWKRRSIFTLRHSAGCPKYTRIKKS